MKKIIAFILALISTITLVSCEDRSESSTNTEETKKTRLDAPEITLTSNIVSWDKVENAGEYVIKINDEVLEGQTELTYEIKKSEAGQYQVSVKAVPTNTTKYRESYYSNVVTYNKLETTSTTIWVVGDSTVCEYATYNNDGSVLTVTDTTYFYDRYGYATQFKTIFDDNVTIKNYAMSGRSSKSFITDESGNYDSVMSKMNKGDYLVIGFGHNDEKNDDQARFSSALDSTDTEGSFKNILYNKYIKPAEDKGVTPILCSPIVRASKTNDYTGSNGHITAYGDYGKAVVELGSEKNVTVIDLTTLTKNLYTELGYEQAQYFHAFTSGNSQTEVNLNSIDTTHINIYGAKMVSYLFAEALKNTNCSLKDYLKNYTKPTKENDLVQNPFYTYVKYTTPDLVGWKEAIAAGSVKNNDGAVVDVNGMYSTITDGWYGSAFGDMGSTDPYKCGYIATETEAGKFRVGQGSNGSMKGKISSTTEGYAFAFRQVSVSKNFKLSGKGTIVTQISDGKQAGFGLMLRDDAYIPTSDKGICSNNIVAGVYQKKAGSNIVGYARQSGGIVESKNTSTLTPAVGTTIEATIERVGQVVTTTVIYNGETFVSTYTDFDLIARDNEYMYVGMCGTRGIIAEWTNVSFQITGDAIAA